MPSLGAKKIKQVYKKYSQTYIHKTPIEFLFNLNNIFMYEGLLFVDFIYTLYINMPYWLEFGLR